MLREHYKSHTTGYENCLSLTADTIHANKIGKLCPPLLTSSVVPASRSEPSHWYIYRFLVDYLLTTLSVSPELSSLTGLCDLPLLIQSQILPVLCSGPSRLLAHAMKMGSSQHLCHTQPHPHLDQLSPQLIPIC